MQVSLKSLRERRLLSVARLEKIDDESLHVKMSRLRQNADLCRLCTRSGSDSDAKSTILSLRIRHASGQARSSCSAQLQTPLPGHRVSQIAAILVKQQPTLNLDNLATTQLV